MVADRSRILTLVLHAAVVVCAAISLVPLLWVVAASIKTGPDLFQYTFLPTDGGGWRRLTLANFATLFGERPMLTWLTNSLFLASTQTLLVVLLGSFGGFGLARYEFAGKRLLTVVMFASMMLPSQVLLPSLYAQIDRIGMMNTYGAILVPGAVSALAMLLFRQAMAGIPEELLAAARVDGCSEWRLWWEVALPYVRPMVGACALMTFVSTWNSLLWPQLVLKDESRVTLPVGLSTISALPQYQADYGVVMAGTVVSIAPVVALFVYMQREFVEGLTSGSIRS